MIEISVNKLNKYYGAKHIIKNVTFEINTGEHVGLLGKNGSGKTTLFKVITGEEFYESGTVAKATKKKIEMLAQIPVFKETDTCEDVLRASFEKINKIYYQMKKLEKNMNDQVLEEYGQLMEIYEQMGGYTTEVKLDKICNGMNIDNSLRESLFSRASGGEQARVNLARILLCDCDTLLLDEPTNHLDLASITWLENFINEFSGTVVIISHDRRFLDNTITRIIELDGDITNFYAGNYTFYVKEKEERRQTQAEQYKQQQRKISQIEAAIHRQRVWAQSNPSNTGLAKRALAMERRIEKMDKVEKPKTSSKLTKEFESDGYIAKQVLSLEHAYKKYGEKIILNDVSVNVLRNERIALVGENGCGKSTLMKIIRQQEKLDSGIVEISASVKCGYMPQTITFEDESETVLNTLRFAFSLGEEKARSILANFQFKAHDVNKKVGTLSGGEKSRLKLCLLMQSNTNFLMLDEPTNHLDIDSREWIETALTNFEGTILFVSHDRYFLSKFASKIWHMQNGAITVYNNTFDEYFELSQKEVAKQLEKNTKQIKKVKQNKTEKLKVKTRIEPTTEEKLKQLELEIEIVVKKMEYESEAQNFPILEELNAQKWRLEKEWETLYEKWFSENS